ncbi:hypothetical protein AWL63_18420 [Sphingomonas panacis]|uniref:Uncharacterized protein n=1 Tax=Sphingomonas panacis TaxID=1560345 RepID=A0A1B3ZDW2_9SPHN|nr:hypothetical protein [Sphingomonas panacis]AOH85617.1 hypothetical protein AWL63_18420 [Sphingomonas panacis]
MRHFSGEFSGLRLLMLDELDAIAGGDGEDTDDVPPPPPDIVVNGHRYSGQIDWGPPLIGGIPIGLGGGGGGGGGGDSGSTGHSEDDDCKNGEAVHLADHIKGLAAQNPLGSQYEFGALIVDNHDGTYGASGDVIQTSYSATYSVLSAPSDYADVRGVVHNHPWNIHDANDNFQQRYPSDPDWQALDTLVARGAPAASLSMYIVDPWGVTREFRYADKASYQAMTSSDRALGNSLPGQTVDCTP